MTTSNSSSQFHFTRRLTFLKSILRNGVRYTYSFERFERELLLNEMLPDIFRGVDMDLVYPQDLGVAIPMACFCDIPLLRTTKHKKAYGNHAIGFDKERLCELFPDLNPVHYVKTCTLLSSYLELTKYKSKLFNECSEIYNDLPGAIEKDINTERKLEELEKIIFDLTLLVGVSKPYRGVSHKNKEECFYDEREWRALWFKGKKLRNDGWKRDLSKSEFCNKATELNAINLRSDTSRFMTVPSERIISCISHIIVSKESQVAQMIECIKKSRLILGSPIKEEDRLHLVSKITSFERIKKDY